MNEYSAIIARMYSFFEVEDGYLVYSRHLKGLEHKQNEIYTYKIDENQEYILSDTANKCNFFLSMERREGEFRTENDNLGDEFYFALLDNNISITQPNEKRMVEIMRRWTINQIIEDDHN